MKTTRRIQREEAEQAAVFEWAEVMSCRYPVLSRLFAIPNGGRRDIRTAVNLKRTGVKRGAPDMCLPFPSHGCHGLWIELKADGGRVSPEQRDWIEWLSNHDYKAVVCVGADCAIDTLKKYLNIRE